MSAATDRPGDGLLDPVVVGALMLLIANDHVFKAAAVGPVAHAVTGKLSDFAGVLFLPALLVGVLELVRRRRASPRAAALVAACVAVTFSLMKSVPAVGALYAEVLGLLQWPARAALAWARGAPAPAVVAAAHVVDPTDIVAVVCAPYVVAQARRRARLATT